MTLNSKLRWLVSLMLLALMLMPIGQLWAQNNSANNFGLGYQRVPSGLGPSLSYFDVETNTSSITYVTLEFTHEGVTQIAQAKFSNFVEVVESETSLHEWLRSFTKIEFVAPEELAGDVFLMTSFRGDRQVFFWNPELLEPLEINGRFEVFGNIPVATLIADSFSAYVPELGNMPRYVEADIPQPETFEEKQFIGRWVNIIENSLEEREDSVHVPYPKIRLLSYNYVLPYQIQLMDEDKNVIKEMHYEDWRNVAQIERPDGQIATYVTELLIIDHVIPGDTTRLIIDRIEYETVELSAFEPESLGQ